MSVLLPNLHFCSPKKLPSPNSLKGRVVVLDIAFSARGLKPSYEEMTGPFIEKLGDRLAAWVDHHDHEFHENFKNDSRFLLSTKSEHAACPEMITPELVYNTGPIDTILCHMDLDGLFSAAKWITGGFEPYKGADLDAAAVDSRKGDIGEPAKSMDFALRVNFREEHLKLAIINHLIAVYEGRKSYFWDEIKETSKKYLILSESSKKLSKQFEVKNKIAFIEVPSNVKFDKTELLLLGQKIATVAVVEYCGNITVAAPFDSGIDFIDMMNLGGGMPTRITIASKQKNILLKTLTNYLVSE